MNYRSVFWLAPALLLIQSIWAPAFAKQYLSVEQAQRVLFPEAEQFISRPTRFTPAQKDFIEEYSKISLRAEEQPIWRVEKNGVLQGWFVLDEVYGKHEFITYAVALNADGTVKGIEILDYRETHGGEVSNPQWRSQFDHKRYGAALKLDEDIDNISGATLSCKHITEGVRRVLAIYESVLK